MVREFADMAEAVKFWKELCRKPRWGLAREYKGKVFIFLHPIALIGHVSTTGGHKR